MISKEDEDIRSKYTQHINEVIESGEYFQEAKLWYSRRYMYAQTQNFYMLLLAMVFGTIAFIMVNVTTTDYITTKIPFPVYIDDSVHDVSHMYPLAKGNENINLSVARYMVTRYTKMRETYNYKLLDEEYLNKLLMDIKSVSSLKTYNQFAKYIDPTINSYSPIVKYRTAMVRNVNVDNIRFNTIEPKPTSAQVYFRVFEIGSDDTTITNWCADISFDMSNINYVLQKKKEISFVVTQYKSYECANKFYNN